MQARQDSKPLQACAFFTIKVTMFTRRRLWQMEAGSQTPRSAPKAKPGLPGSSCDNPAQEDVDYITRSPSPAPETIRRRRSNLLACSLFDLVVDLFSCALLGKLVDGIRLVRRVWEPAVPTRMLG